MPAGTGSALVDFLQRMTALDVLLIVIWFAALAWGWIAGVIRLVFALGALFGAMVLGAAIGPLLSQYVGFGLRMTQEDVLPFVYFVVVIAAAVLLHIAALISYPETRLYRWPAADRLGGGIVGFTVGLMGIIQLAEMLRLITAEPWAIVDGIRANVSLTLQLTPFLPWLFGFFPYAAAAVQTLLPR